MSPTILNEKKRLPAHSRSERKSAPHHIALATAQTPRSRVHSSLLLMETLQAYYHIQHTGWLQWSVTQTRLLIILYRQTIV